MGLGDQLNFEPISHVAEGFPRRKAHAQSKGMSLNAYIVALIEKDMGTLED